MAHRYRQLLDGCEKGKSRVVHRLELMRARKDQGARIRGLSLAGKASSIEDVDGDEWPFRELEMAWTKRKLALSAIETRIFEESCANVARGYGIALQGVHR